jgi:hypothetical protein
MSSHALSLLSEPLSEPTRGGHRPSDPHASPRTRLAWRLQRGADAARCVICTVSDRVELHITMTRDLVMSQQCKGPDQASAISSAWWSALIDRGWIEAESHWILRPKTDRRSQTCS